MIDYQQFVETLFDTNKIKKETPWETRWMEAQSICGIEVDNANPEYRTALQQFFFERNNYEFQEYWTGRKYLAQLSDSINLDPSEDATDIDKVFETKGKNFDRIKALSARLKELEKLLYLENAEVKDAALAGKAKSLFAAGPLERRNAKRN